VINNSGECAQQLDIQQTRVAWFRIAHRINSSKLLNTTLIIFRWIDHKIFATVLSDTLLWRFADERLLARAMHDRISNQPPVGPARLVTNVYRKVAGTETPAFAEKTARL
jgi:hypothetical protein